MKETAVAHGNELEERLEMDAPRRDTWMQRHGAVVIMSIFGLIVAAAIVYEKIGH